MIYTWKSCITLIHILVSIKRCEEVPRNFTTIIHDLIPMIEKIAVKSDEAMIITEAYLTQLGLSGGACTVCVCEKVAASLKEFVDVVLSIDLEWVKVHPTNFVRPTVSDTKTRF